MNKHLLKRNTSPAIPVLGLPIKGYSNTFIAAKTFVECRLDASYRLIKCGKQTHRGLNGINQLESHIKDYVSRITSELLDLCIDGSVELKCSDKIPDISLFVMGTTELLLDIFDIRRVDYLEYLKTFAILDQRFWGINPSYIASIRCSYLFEEGCISRDLDEIVRVKPLRVGLVYVDERPCTNSVCMELTPPFDNISTLHIIKLTSHIAAKIVRDLVERGLLSDETLRLLRLLYDIEFRTVVESLGEPPQFKSPIYAPVKPIPDTSSMKFYLLKL